MAGRRIATIKLPYNMCFTNLENIYLTENKHLRNSASNLAQKVYSFPPIRRLFFTKRPNILEIS